MSEGNLILKNWLQQKDIFIKNLIISRDQPTKNSVHDLRVAVKKMRSYLRLNEELSKEEWKNSFIEIKELFTSFGKLRDFDMALALCKNYEKEIQSPLSSFKQYLAANRSLTKRWAKQAAINFNEPTPSLQFSFDLFDELQFDEAAEKIVNLSDRQIETVKHLKEHFQKNAHKIRKRLKDVLYWLMMLPEDMREKIDSKQLDASLKYLGLWQDQFIFKRKLRYYAKELATGNEKVILNELRNKAEDLQKELLQKAEKKLNRLYK